LVQVCESVYTTQRHSEMRSHSDKVHSSDTHLRPSVTEFLNKRLPDK